ncbi:MAG TPA: hypothetical protein ENI23_14255 [bacterium]|nr:hypothetical protein [bacterium]
MPRILFIGDQHIYHSSPASRKDDYPSVVFEKIAQISRLCVELEIDVCVFSGDMFTAKAIPVTYMIRVIGSFSALRAYAKKTKFYTLVGNHDLYNYDLSTLERTPLGLMIYAGVIEQLVGTTDFNGVELIAGSCNEPLIKATNPENIFFGHYFYGNQWNDKLCLLDDDIIRLGYKVVCLGHDHALYDDIKHPRGFTVLRPGSLMRGSSHRYNLEREVFVQLVEFTDRFTFQKIKLDTKPAEEVFYDKAIQKTDRVAKETILSFVEALKETAKVETNSAYKILDGLGLEPILFEYIATKFQEHGIYREN